MSTRDPNRSQRVPEPLFPRERVPQHMPLRTHAPLDRALAQIRSHIPDFGERQPVLADLRLLLRRFNVATRDTSEYEDAYLARRGNRMAIVFKRGLEPLYRLWCGFHELGHLLMHPHDFSGVRGWTWNAFLEADADRFAGRAFQIQDVERTFVDGDYLVIVYGREGRELWTTGQTRLKRYRRADAAQSRAVQRAGQMEFPFEHREVQ